MRTREREAHAHTYARIDRKYVRGRERQNEMSHPQPSRVTVNSKTSLNPIRLFSLKIKSYYIRGRNGRPSEIDYIYSASSIAWHFLIIFVFTFRHHLTLLFYLSGGNIPDFILSFSLVFFYRHVCQLQTVLQKVEAVNIIDVVLHLKKRDGGGVGWGRGSFWSYGDKRPRQLWQELIVGYTVQR